MKKRPLSLLLALALCLGLSAPALASGETEPASAETAEEAQVRARIEALKSRYPEGMTWTNDNAYYSSVLGGGAGCAGFAYLCSDAAFGDAPVTGRHSNFDDIRAGDILRINNDTHSVIVLEKRADSVVAAEGNYNSSIHWGREISRASLESGGLAVTSRWGAAREEPWAAASDWARAEVEAAITAGLVPEDLQTDYTADITRLDFCRLMVKLVERSSGKPIADYLSGKGLTAADPFTDTDDSDVLAARALGIVKGTGDGAAFTPGGSITRQEAAAMLARTAKALGLKPGAAGTFHDESSFPDWAKEGIEFVSGLAAPETGRKVMEGTGDGNFTPLGTYTREQAVLTSLRLFHCAG